MTLIEGAGETLSNSMIKIIKYSTVVGPVFIDIFACQIIKPGVFLRILFIKIIYLQFASNHTLGKSQIMLKTY